MTNKEKYAEQIIENFFDGVHSTGMDKESGKFMACEAPATCERCMFKYPYNEHCTNTIKKWLNTKAEKFKHIFFYDENNNLIELSDEDEKRLTQKTFNRIFKIVVKDKSEIQDFLTWWDLEPDFLEDTNITSEGIYVWNSKKLDFEKVKSETDIFNKIKAMNEGESITVARTDTGYIIL